MKNITKRLGLLFVTSLLALAGCTGNSPKDSEKESESESTGRKISGQIYNVESPNGKLEVQLTFTSLGELYYQVFKNNVCVVDYSQLGFEFEEANLDILLEIKDTKTETINTVYENKTGRHSLVQTSATEFTLSLTDTIYDMDVIVRAYNEGYAFKYVINNQSKSEEVLHILKEDSEFAIPANSTAWTMNFTSISNANNNPNCFSYEDNYQLRTVDSLVTEYVSMPMIYRVGKTSLYCHISESGLIGSGYYGSFLTGSSEDETKSILHTVHSPASNNVDKETEKEINLPFTSPWRVGTVGTLADIVDAELIEAVYDNAEYWKPEDYSELSSEEKLTYNYDWVEDGVCAWSWLRYTSTDRSQQDFTLHEEYLTHAINMGWKYIILDGGWIGANDVANLAKKLTERAHKNGVKVLGWVNALDFSKGTSLTSLKSLLRVWKSWGIDGIKIDFFDGQTVQGGTVHQGEDKQTIEWYEHIYQECAKLQMVVNCHGSNKPTGERRIYPNVINREAIKGNEMGSVSSQTIVNSMYTRMLAGPTDWTPTVEPRNKAISKAELMGIAVLYESGSVSASDYVDAYSDTKIRSFWQKLPCLWDDSHFVGGDLDQYACIARKKGADWYVGCASCTLARTIEVDFSFLGEGSYTASIYRDGEDYFQYRKETTTVTRSSKINIDVMKNGGFAITLEKN